MKSRTVLACLALGLGLAACGADRDEAQDVDATGETDMMEGGGVYPSATVTNAADPLSTDPAAAATYNEAQNMAPTGQTMGTPPGGQVARPASPAPTSAGR